MIFIKAGLQVSVQDRGRWGFQSQGVPVSGAMDEDALVLANLLVGNNMDQACIELSSGSSEIKFENDSLIALCGHGLSAYLNGVAIPTERSILVKQGSMLKFKPDGNGMWTYLAVGGGFDLIRTLNSQSTYPLAGIGGATGKNIVTGDAIECNNIKSTLTIRIEASLKSEGRNLRIANWGVSKNRMMDRHIIRIYAGHEWDWLTEEGKKILLGRAFTLSINANRMGYRLLGEKLKRNDQTELISTTITQGTVQLTHEGSLIAAMADGQTVGGYPRVVQVAAVDLSKFAQIRIAESFRFELISFAEAENLFLVRAKERQAIANAIRLNFNKNDPDNNGNYYSIPYSLTHDFH